MSNITCRVPQDSVLGPLLFIIYTIDLPQGLLHSRCVLLILLVKNIHLSLCKIAEDLKPLTDWFKANKSYLNVNKMNYMIFTKSDNAMSQHTLKMEMK